MASVDEIRSQILQLDPQAAAELADWFILDAPLNREVAPGIEVDPRVSGGDPRIAKTRIAVWILEQFRRLGVSDADLLRKYPTLTAQDLAYAWSYVAGHREEINHQIQEHETA